MYYIPNRRYCHPFDYIYSDFYIGSRFDLTKIRKIHNIYSNRLENDTFPIENILKVCYFNIEINIRYIMSMKFHDATL